jgi:two-component system, cell cycle sensor histidine kinase and response regulator CckA
MLRKFFRFLRGERVYTLNYISNFKTYERGGARNLIVYRQIKGNVQMSNKHKEETRFQTILECSRLGTWEWNVQTGETTFNEVWAQIVGYTLCELAPVSIETWNRLAHPDDLITSKKLLERHFSGELPYYDCVSRMKHKNGHWVWVQDRGKVVSWSDDGKPLLMLGSHEDVTEYKLVEETLRKSEDNYRLLFLNMNSYNSLYEVVTDKDGKPCDFRFIMVNNAYEKYIGKNACELIGKTLLEVYPATEQYWIDKMTEVVLTGVPTHFENFSQVMNTCTEINLYVPQKGQLAMTTSNIDDRKRAEDALQESEQYYRTLLDNLPTGIVVHGADSAILVSNAMSESILGLTEDQLRGRTAIDPYWRFLREDGSTMPHAEYPVNRVLATGKGFHDLVIGRPISGSQAIVWASCNAYPVHGTDGKIAQVVVSFNNITERKIAEEALKANEEKFRAIAANTPDHILMQDCDQRYTFVLNPQMGLTADDMIGKTDHDFLEAADAQKLTAIKRNVLESGAAYHLETSLTNKAGQIEYFDGSYVPTYDAMGKANGLIGYFRNVTTQKKTDDELKRMKYLLSEGQRMSHQGSFEYIVGTHETIWSEEEFRIYGLAPTAQSPVYEDMLKNNIHPDDAAALHKTFGDALQNKLPYEMEHRIIRPDGSVRTVYDLAHPYFDSNGKLIKYIGITLDLTDRMRSEQVRLKYEQQLQQNQKLESLGLLAGGIAHDFNNLMGGIFGYIDMANEEPERGKISSYLSKAMNTIERARALTGQLLTFSKGGAPIQKIGYLFPFVEETTRFALSGANVSCHFDVPQDLWACNFDKNQIGQVIDNIIINAQQAMPIGGTIELSARNITIAEKEHPTIKKGNYVKISVRDSGIGIQKDLVSRIFDPFFTTKSKGHGLGLATCYSIVNRHGGCIDVESEPGNGSTFHIYLPASTDPVLWISDKPTAMHKGCGTFLIMDDEEVMRETISDMLKSLGYSVVCKDNGMDAIEFFASETTMKREITGMIFDLTVPGGMGGKAAVEAIRKLNTEIPVFVASGYAEDPVMKNPAEYGFTASICKPFRKSELSEILNKYMQSQK